MGIRDILDKVLPPVLAEPVAEAIDRLVAAGEGMLVEPPTSLSDASLQTTLYSAYDRLTRMTESAAAEILGPFRFSSNCL